MIPRVLERRYEDGGYTVVDPRTTLFTLSDEGSDQRSEKQYLKKELRKSGFNVDSLVDELFQKNSASVRLSLASDRARGYLIDHDGRFQSFFDAEDGRGWEKWYEHHPEAHGHTRVSLPAFDESTGLLLIYIGTQKHWEDGAGFLKLYNVEGDKIEEAWSVGLWIS